MNEVWHARFGIVVRARAVEPGPGGEDLATGTWARPKRCRTAFAAGACLPLACLIAIAVCAFTAAGNNRFTTIGQWIRRAG